MERVSRDTPRFKNELDAVVFICKQFWTLAFNKQVDNLKTNHQVTRILILSYSCFHDNMSRDLCILHPAGHVCIT